MSARFETFISRLKNGASPVELVYLPHNRWPIPQDLRTSHNTSNLRISVLDSSFNPPTLAHRALASVSLPPIRDREHSTSLPAARDYDARLLLLSVRNADKALKATDATYEERMEMMVLLAKDIITEGQSVSVSSNDGHQGTLANTAVGIIDEPTFVGKSRILHDFLLSRISSLSKADSTSAELDPHAPTSVHAPRPQLTFIVGIDTLERILSPHYYTSDESMRSALKQFLSADGDDSYLVCARRTSPGLLISNNERERTVLSSVQEYVDPLRVTLVDIGEAVQTYSSSEVRERIGRSDGDTVWTQMVIASIAEYIKSKGLYGWQS